ncbi:Uncharacterized protein Adt_18311 [Abeliophyllum distichum]|uniref:Ubiquitin-like protease family profile domain-containing protein n=1 Tax=Abeliophyllum distichum TaxID=126358 RepID=A0ABD1TJ06_9LAMI
MVCKRFEAWEQKFHRDDLHIHPSWVLVLIHIDSKMWWYELHQVATLLNDRHIDAMFYFFRMMLKLSGCNKIRATTTDCTFDVKIRRIFEKFSKDTNAIAKHSSLLLYLTGYKIPFNTHWREVDHVFIPICMDKRANWILGHFDIRKWCINVYNSCTRSIRDAYVFSAVESFRTFIPYLLRQSNVFKFELPNSPLSCTIIKDIPQQTNGGDCRIFIIKYVEYIAQQKIKEMPEEV